MVKFNINSNIWNVLCLLLLFAILSVLLTVESPKDLNTKKIIYSKMISRQLKTFAEIPNPTQQVLENNKPRIKQKEIPLIYAITPTYYRLTQMADLTRMANTLRQVRRLHWIVVEDWTSTNHHLHEFLVYTNISFTYISQATKESTNASKGNDQKNAAIQWITRNHRWGEQAVVYFADDDNAYDLRLFEEMRYTQKVSMWPVGLTGGNKAETPVVEDGKVTGFIGWATKYRVFAVDMAGFAVNVNVLWDYHPMLFETQMPAYTCCTAETKFLEQCCTIEDIEPRADNCTKVYVWHTKTGKPKYVKNDARLDHIYV
ncbi:Galactosylgalactosylxylosylprotein 3-beta-glucuronosyltransferase 1,Galactosylgalactosylxylosylprotein 3-beta-glucuronosyltransferase 3,Galactosylgalactosylxylosylprotein 3-beta-glucuronosyltransferase 2 [Mytilus edulis]|uniref:Galactosylgalactosylxylosylprotein 3-beta-glucuronosyltransferase n=1 Tax=Mytilus edulis TaxID=6550 RepID=A0A8S3TD48_MYTED|nr:Galactosylgalactosylxylosylprotein 3-beta-glucuronosyltransferase 1,Galactosylgalactosylxylosylprotein 3-beta-glucuronosyltransferase 3,Galactosylgalactosylxylosylprotein 3-beta-glucuronosyltransferase 2 [Mytilus edulis]